MVDTVSEHKPDSTVHTVSTAWSYVSLYTARRSQSQSVVQATDDEDDTTSNEMLDQEVDDEDKSESEEV